MKYFFVPKGFKAAGVRAGFKKEKLDFAVFAADAPCKWAGVFTTNKMAAHPVLDAQKKLGGNAKAIKGFGGHLALSRAFGYRRPKRIGITPITA